MDNSNIIDENSPLFIENNVPDYKKITPSEVNHAIPLLLKDLSSRFQDLELVLKQKLADQSSLNWQDVLSPLHAIEEHLRCAWSAVSHLNAVCNTTELREAYSFQQPSVVRFSNQLGQSKIIHQALTVLLNDNESALDQTQIRIIEKELLSMKHRGVGLSGKKQLEFNADSERLAELSNHFSNNLLDSTKQWSLLLTNKSDIAGLPLRALELYAISAQEFGDTCEDNTPPSALKGPWRVGLDMPRYIPFMTFADNRQLRERVYKAYVSRASKGSYNNQPLIEEILLLRKKQANRLGYENWAELSLISKMAKKIQSVESLLEELRSASYPYALNELSDLKHCAKKNGVNLNSDFANWDLLYWSERLRQERFNLNQEQLRPWFPLPQVLEGLFHLCERLFEISIKPFQGKFPTWHEDVQFFQVLDNDGNSLAYFYLDPYSRPSSKRAGAWMDECIGRSKSENGELILPIAYLVCNQSPPTGNKPSLMSFEEVETLFHEFGHGLQHMLTTVDYPQAAGINNVEWDAVELPSQFMENWCLDRKNINNIAKHWETGEPLPEEEFKKLLSNKTFNAGLSTLRQVYFALTDLKLHASWDNSYSISPDELRKQIALNTTVLPPLKEDQSLCSFSHIFSGGYSAGYYSYKWAEVLSADAYSAFEDVEQQGEDHVRLVGKRFRDTVLSLGGSRCPNDVYFAFRGRSPNSKALLRHSGLTDNRK